MRSPPDAMLPSIMQRLGFDGGVTHPGWISSPLPGRAQRHADGSSKVPARISQRFSGQFGVGVVLGKATVGDGMTLTCPGNRTGAAKPKLASGMGGGDANRWSPA
jgi:hypothetical protein